MISDRFAELRPALERAHAAARSVVPQTGCQLGASLLALELGRAGERAAYVCGRYSQDPQREHWWVDVGGMVLDPTRDQFGGDPLAECYSGEYREEDRKPASAMEREATSVLRCNWGPDRRGRPAMERVADQYGLSLDEIRRPMVLVEP